MIESVKVEMCPCGKGQITRTEDGKVILTAKNIIGLLVVNGKISKNVCYYCKKEIK